MSKEHPIGRPFSVVSNRESVSEWSMSDEEKAKHVDLAGKRIMHATVRSANHSHKKRTDGRLLYSRNTLIDLPDAQKMLLIYNSLEGQREPTDWMAAAYLHDITHEMETGLFGVATIRRLVVGRSADQLTFESYRFSVSDPTAIQAKDDMLAMDNERIVPRRELSTAEQLRMLPADDERITRYVADVLGTRILQHRFHMAQSNRRRIWFGRKKPFSTDQSS